MKLALHSVWDYVVRWCLYAAVFITPFFFLPWTLYPVGLNKHLVFTSLIFIAFIAWIIKAVAGGKFVYSRGALTGIILFLVASSLISAVLSGSWVRGFMGVDGGEVDTVLAMLALGLLWFLISAVFTNEQEMRALGIISAVAAAVVLIISFLQLLGWGFFPWDFTQSAAFNPIGTTNALALYLGGMFVFVFGMAYARHLWAGRVHGALCVLAGALGIISILLGYWPVFVGWIASMALIAIFDVRTHGAQASRRVLIPLAIMVFSLFLAFVSLGVLTVSVPQFRVPAEVTPSISASWQIAKNTLRESVGNFFFGSGPITYQYQYSMYRDAGLNQSFFWNIRFSQGFNALLTYLVSWGMVGFLAFIAFLAVLVRMVLRVAAQDQTKNLGTIGIAAALAYFVILPFVYPQNFVLNAMLFMVAGMLTVIVRGDDEDGQREISIISSPQKTFVVSLIAMIVIMVTASLLYSNGRRYVGALQFARGVALANETGAIAQALPLLLSGRDLDPRNDVYLQVLSTAFLTRVNELAASAGAEPSPQLQAQISAMIGASVESARRATEVNPNNVINWIALARAYESIMPLVDGAAVAAFNGYEKALQREPNNPAILTGLARAHMAAADVVPRDQRDTEYQAALENLDKAIILKSDYAPAHFALVQVFDQQGKNEEAIARAERLKSLAPNDVGILFQIGLLHYQANRFNKARDAFEETVAQAPDYANALYFLGLVYDRQGDRDAALEQFQRIIRLNPDNKEVIVIVDNLRAGRPALSNAIAQPAPLEEGEKEILQRKKK